MAHRLSSAFLFSRRRAPVGARSAAVATVPGADQLDAAGAKNVLDLAGAKRQRVDGELPAQSQPALLARAVDDAQPDRTRARVAIQYHGEAVDEVLLVLA